jgi:hypothetical protein
VKPNKVPPMRPTIGPPVVTYQKLAFLNWVRAGGTAGVDSSWLARMLVADGLLRERSNDLGPLTGASVPAGELELTVLGLVALDRGRVGPIAI